MEDATPSFSQEPPSSSDPHLVRLQEILVSCSQFVGSGGISEVGILMTELGECLDYVSDNSASDPDNENVQRTSDQMLSVILEFVKSSSTDQVLIFSVRLVHDIGLFNCSFIYGNCYDSVAGRRWLMNSPMNCRKQFASSLGHRVDTLRLLKRLLTSLY